MSGKELLQELIRMVPWVKSPVTVQGQGQMMFWVRLENNQVPWTRQDFHLDLITTLRPVS